MKAQGSLEYLLILAAILAIAVVVVVVANSMMNPASTAANIQQDKYIAASNGMEFIDYNEPMEFSTTLNCYYTAPSKIKYQYEGETIVMDEMTNGCGTAGFNTLEDYENTLGFKVLFKLSSGYIVMFRETNNEYLVHVIDFDGENGGVIKTYIKNK